METNPAERKSNKAIASAVMLAINVPGLVLLTVETVLKGARVAKMHREMFSAVPKITEIMLYTISPTAYLGILSAIAVGLLAKEFLIRNKAVTITINIACFIVTLVFLAVHVVACFYPMIILIESMGQPR